jgi:hypothetical protein
VVLGNVKHSNGKYFKKWTSADTLYSWLQWTGGMAYENAETVTYTATLAYSVVLSLKTK